MPKLRRDYSICLQHREYLFARDRLECRSPPTGAATIRMKFLRPTGDTAKNIRLCIAPLTPQRYDVRNLTFDPLLNGLNYYTNRNKQSVSGLELPFDLVENAVTIKHLRNR